MSLFSESLENLKNSPKFSLSLALGLFGAFLNFISVCLKQSTSEAISGYNPYGLDWFLAFFYLTSLGTLVGIVATGSLERYRLGVVALLALTLAYLPANISSNLLLASVTSTKTSISLRGEVSSVTDSRLSSGGSLGAAGLIMIVIPMFLMMAWVGSSEDAFVNAAVDNLQISTKPAVVVVQEEKREETV